MNRKAAIISIKGLKLLPEEKEIIFREKPWGIILFKRNIKNFYQTKQLTESIRRVIKDKHYPILIDEEGGSVCRLTKIIDNSVYSQKFFGDLYKRDKKLSLYILKNYIYSISQVFKKLGININTSPVLDLRKKISHKIIKDRCFSDKLNEVKKLGYYCINYYKKNSIGTVIKHIPGHGSARVDSHFKLPVINLSYKQLQQNDFKCFDSSNSLFAMTAHILFKKLDKRYPVTFSKKIIHQIIRKKLRYGGILISDDIEMKALKYDIITNAKKSLIAGCNLILYCGGDYKISKKILKETPIIDEFTKKKTSEFYKLLR